jgi:hypothetical protein
MFEAIKDKKKLLDKLKKICTAATKFNLNSPCLLQLVRYKGEYEWILTHNPDNGDRFDTFKIFSTVTKDNFIIREEDRDCFEMGDDRTSIPLILTTFNFVNQEMNVPYVMNIKFHTEQHYDYGLDSYYIFPKFVLKAIKEEKITDINTYFRSFHDGKGTFNFNIDIAVDERFNYSTLFIYNEQRLDNLYNLYILPFEYPNKMNDLYLNHNNDCVSYIILDPVEWEKTFEANKYVSGIHLEGANHQDILIYHNDFLQKKIANGMITKKYESAINDLKNNNIVSLYFNIELNNGIYEFFKYRYYEYGRF